MSIHNWPQRAVIGSATVAGLALATTAAGGWHFANELLRGRKTSFPYPITVVAVTDSTITLAGPGADEPGVLGLVDKENSYALVGAITSSDDGHTTRQLTPYPHTPAVGAHVRIDKYAAPSNVIDYRKVSGLSIEETSYQGPLGRYPATYIPPRTMRPPQNRWVIHVHGRDGTRAEGYRVAPTISDLGYPQLSISYRNDHDAPAGANGQFGLGWTEPEDLSSAIDYTRTRGAREFILVGYSMGAAIIGNYLRTHDHKDVVGIIYDSPALSWPDIIASEAATRGLPKAGASLALRTVRLRTGINVWAMDQVRSNDYLTAPILLIHGDNDETVPVTSSDAFAAARKDVVTYLRTTAGHVRNWNIDPAVYERAVRTFLTQLKR